MQSSPRNPHGGSSIGILPVLHMIADTKCSSCSQQKKYTQYSQKILCAVLPTGWQTENDWLTDSVVNIAPKRKKEKSRQRISLAVSQSFEDERHKEKPANALLWLYYRCWRPESQNYSNHSKIIRPYNLEWLSRLITCNSATVTQGKVNNKEIDETHISPC